jgi:hypothetical protein
MPGDARDGRLALLQQLQPDPVHRLPRVLDPAVARRRHMVEGGKHHADQGLDGELDGLEDDVERGGQRRAAAGRPRERVERVAEAREAHDVEGRAGEPVEGVQAHDARAAVHFLLPDLAELYRISARAACGLGAHTHLIGLACEHAAEVAHLRGPEGRVEQPALAPMLGALDKQHAAAERARERAHGHRPLDEIIRVCGDVSEGAQVGRRDVRALVAGRGG